jgi:hypothetical protein
MLVEQNINLPGVVFNHGFDVTSDNLNTLQQYLINELTDITKDFIKYPGFSWGLQIGDIAGQNITITAGAAVDQNGIRLNHPSATAYKISAPTGSTGTIYLCVKASIQSVGFKIHPYDGSRHSTETVVGLEFFIDSSTYTGVDGMLYPSGNNGLIIYDLTVSGSTYGLGTGVRSPNLKLKDG